jgi:transglutaminase-like putative cysteine protease
LVPALLAFVPALVIAQNWLRLEHPEQDGMRAVWLIVLAVVPALGRRWRERLALLAGTTLVAVAVAVRVSPLDARPWDGRHDFFGPFASRLWNGLLDFYDVKLPFDPSFHPEMHALLLAAGFGFAAALGLVCAARRPLAAVLVLLVGAGWPATLLPDGRDLIRGAVILAAALFVLAGFRSDARRTVGRAAVGAAALVAIALAASTQPAVAKSEFLRWQSWDPYTRPDRPVNVRYVWDSSYDGFRFPRKVTTVFKVKAAGRSVYWRAAALDTFIGGRWVEDIVRTAPSLFDGRNEIPDPIAPAGALDASRWQHAQFEIAGLADEHVPAPSVPVAYGLDFGDATYAVGGTALLRAGLHRGQQYNVWSYSPAPTPAQLARSAADYPAPSTALPAAGYSLLGRDVEISPSQSAPPFGAPDRARKMDQLFRAYSGYLEQYRPLYNQARRVVGNATSPYSAAVALESWLRRTGGFHYDQRPARTRGIALVEFVTHTKRGYCQHFAGAMALMLRYLGIPARVAAGFTSGTYDQDTGTWTVTDHDAHAWVEVWFKGYGWMPFDPTPGRGSLSAPYSVSSPRFDSSAAALLVAGIAGKLLDTFDIHQERGFGDLGTRGDRAFIGADPKSLNQGGSGATQRGGSLGRLLALVAVAMIMLLALAKAVRRQLRYATNDPRRVAAALRAELVDFLADQRVHIATSAPPEELARELRRRFEIDGSAFTRALAEARYGPPERAGSAALRARRELRKLEGAVRGRVGRFRRARGLVSLRSLGVSG